jgi:hypothetical protein
MKAYFFGAFVVVSLLAIGVYSAPSPAPSGAPTAVPSPGPSSVMKLTPSEASRLLQEFQKAQDVEIQALKHQHQAEMKELDASLKARYKDWVAKEQDARHRFLSGNPDLKRDEKRAYIADYRVREKAFLQFQKSERAERLRTQDARMGSVKADQASRLKEFKDELAQGKIPPIKLWPE